MTLAPHHSETDALEGLRSIAGPAAVCPEEATGAYLREPRDRYQGRAALVLRPDCTEMVAAIVRHCAAHRLPIVPYGGGTGLVGGQVSPDGAAPVVVSLDRMSRIRAVLPDDNALIAEAGVILEDIQRAAEEAGRLFPLSLAAQGSCRIGGNLATNAGGVQVLRYGNARDLCLGLEAVLPDGQILHGLRTLRKDNTGYDLRHLLIGSEGTLGIITAAALKLFPRPGETATAMLAVSGPGDAVRLLHALRERLGDQITAFELIDGRGIGFVRQFFPDITDPLAPAPAWRVLVECTGAGASGLVESVEDALAATIEAGLVQDGVLASSEAQRRAMWHLRETIPEANRKRGAIASHDISVPVSRIAEFVEDGAAAIARLDASLVVNCFGHVGDGNLHYNLFPPAGQGKEAYTALRGAISRAVHDLVASHDGSISAEHGIGRLKTAELNRYGDPAKLSVMRAVKAALDPHNIMNPGAVLSL